MPRRRRGKSPSRMPQGRSRGAVVGMISQVIGGAFLLLALILFGIGLSQLDTAYTSAKAYDAVGLTDIMGIFGMLLFLTFIGTGLTVLAGGAVYNWMTTVRGSWMESFMSFAYGAVALVIALILNTVVQGQLNTAQVAINAATNIASFPGLYNISRIFGMLVFLSLVGTGIAAIVASGVAAVRTIRGGI